MHLLILYWRFLLHLETLKNRPHHDLFTKHTKHSISVSLNYLSYDSQQSFAKKKFLSTIVFIHFIFHMKMPSIWPSLKFIDKYRGYRGLIDSMAFNAVSNIISVILQWLFHLSMAYFPIVSFDQCIAQYSF